MSEQQGVRGVFSHIGSDRNTEVQLPKFHFYKNLTLKLKLRSEKSMQRTRRIQELRTVRTTVIKDSNKQG